MKGPARNSGFTEFSPAKREQVVLAAAIARSWDKEKYRERPAKVSTFVGKKQ
jgi:hypothetical protein